MNLKKTKPAPTIEEPETGNAKNKLQGDYITPENENNSFALLDEVVL